MNRTIRVGEGAATGRLDVFLARELNSTRSHIQKLLSGGHVQVNGQTVPARHQVKPGDIINIEEPEPVAQATPSVDLPIMYEDDDLLVVDKPAGLTVHLGNSATSGTQPTVVTFIRSRTTDPDPDRPGIVHRLDKDTSGLLILAKSAESKAALQKQFSTRVVHKTYLLLTVGHPNPAEAEIRLPTGRHPGAPLKRAVVPTGRPAITRYRTLAEYTGYSLIEAKPETGRTHQLRVHFAAIGHPVAGDTTYGPPRRPLHLKRQFLHAAALDFTTPSGHKLHLESPLPDDLEAALKQVEHQV